MVKLSGTRRNGGWDTLASPVFEKGEDQTSRLADRLASIKFTQLYSSDFVNHLNLSEIRATLGNVAVIELPGTGITWT